MEVQASWMALSTRTSQTSLSLPQPVFQPLPSLLIITQEPLWVGFVVHTLPLLTTILTDSLQPVLLASVDIEELHASNSTALAALLSLHALSLPA